MLYYQSEDNMNTGQMMITMAAMVLLSTVVLNVNRNALNSTQQMAESKYQILGVSLGTALLEEAFSKPFDDATTAGNLADDLTDLSLTLGPDSTSDLDDFDDYNNYTDSTSSDPTLISADFIINSQVYYVDPATSSQLTPVSYRTWHKKMDVNIVSPFLNDGLDTIKLSKVYSHYYFR